MSKIIAIMPCRNSAWILGLSARALLMWVDELHILLHACTDNTRQIVEELKLQYPKQVAGYVVREPIWKEMSHRDFLLGAARANHATHIVTIDDDEVISGNLLPKIREWVLGCPPNVIMQLPWLQLRGGVDRVISTGMWAEQSASMAFVDKPALHWAARAAYDHHHRHPMGMSYATYSPLNPSWDNRYQNRTGGLMHLQMTSQRRLLWKHLHYKLTERLRWPDRSVALVNAMYDRTVNECAAAATLPVPESWWTLSDYTHLMQYLYEDAEPWQEAEARRMLAENPGLGDGLTTYGLELSVKARPVTEKDCLNKFGEIIPPG